MSLISDALKKAQQERDGGRPLDGFPEHGTGLNDHHAPRPLWKSPLVMVAAAALVLGLLGVWLTRPGPQVPVISNEPLVKTVAPVQQDPAAEEPPAVETVPVDPQPAAAEVVTEAVTPQKPESGNPAVTPEIEETRSGKTTLPEPKEAVSRVKAETGKPEMSPEDEVEITLRTAASADDYVRLYQMLRRRSDPRAFEMVKRGLADFPDNGVLNQLALIGYVRSREYGQALLHADLALRQSPDDASLLTYRGLCYFHQKDFPGALADFSRSLALDPEATENIYYLALIYDNQGQYETAIRYYRMFLDRHPQERSFRHKDYILDRLGQLDRRNPKE
jgi:hypothetical protein